MVLGANSGSDPIHLPVHSFIHSFNSCRILSVYEVGRILGNEETGKLLFSHSFHSDEKVDQNIKDKHTV